MESETKRIKQFGDKPQPVAQNPIINPQQNNQQGIQVIQQPLYIQSNQVIIPQQNLANQQIIFHPINYQPVVIGPGQPNYIVGNQVLPVLAGTPANFTTKRAKMVCPYCGNSIKTNVKLSFNLFKCCIFFYVYFL